MDPAKAELVCWTVLRGEHSGATPALSLSHHHGCARMLVAQCTFFAKAWEAVL